MKITNRPHRIAFAIIFLITPIFLVFQNCGKNYETSASSAASFSPTVIEMLRIAEKSGLLTALQLEAKRLNTIIMSAESDVVSDQIMKLKRIVDNRIAAEAVASTCQDLLAVDPTLISGIYTLYKSAGSNPMLAECIVENGQVTSERIYQ